MLRTSKKALLLIVIVGGAYGIAGLPTAAIEPRPAPRAPVRDRVVAGADADDPVVGARALELLFSELRRTWNPRVKARIVARAKTDADRLGPQLLEILLQPDHEQLAGAIALAPEFRVEGTHQALVALTELAPEPLRPAALTAAAKLAPWPPEDLREFLRSPDAAMRTAAVPLAAVGPRPIVRDLVMMFADADESVRQLVERALPRQLPAPFRLELRAMAAETNVYAQYAALRAMRRVALDDEDETLLCNLVGDADHEVRLAALDVLSGKPGRLRDPSSVWALASAAQVDPAEQAQAICCLERTASYSVDAVEKLLPAIRHVLPRFFAARCLVVSGRKSGAMALLDLLDDDVDWKGGLAGQSADPAALKAGIRSILAQVCGTRTDAGTEVWQQWLQGEDDLPPRPLAPTVLLPQDDDETGR